MAIQLIPIGEGSKNAGKYLATFQYGENGKYTGFIFNVANYKTVFDKMTLSNTFERKCSVKLFSYKYLCETFMNLFGFAIVARKLEDGTYRYGYTDEFVHDRLTGQYVAKENARVVFFDTITEDYMIKRDVGVLEAQCYPIFPDMKNYEKLIEDRATKDGPTKQRKWIDLETGEIGIGEEYKKPGALYYMTQYVLIVDENDPRHDCPWGKYQPMVKDWEKKHPNSRTPRVPKQEPEKTLTTPDIPSDPDMEEYDNIEQNIVNPPVTDIL